MAEEKKVQGSKPKEDKAVDGKTTEERSACKLSAVITQIMQLIEDSKPNQQDADEFIQQATGMDIQTLALLNEFIDAMLKLVLRYKVEQCMKKAQQEGKSPMAAMISMQEELGEFGLECIGMVGGAVFPFEKD